MGQSGKEGTSIGNVKSKTYVRRAVVEDAKYLAQHLREADRRELEAISFFTPQENFLYGIKHTEAYVICYDGLPVGLFGCGNQGEVWMMATDDVTKCSSKFIRKSREWVKHFHTTHKKLWNYVDVRNTLHIRWLKWCGFTFDSKPSVVNGHLFHYFQSIRE